MKLTRLDIQAFGCLSDLGEDIASGLHIFHGPNESGKSTLQRATLALLYGFYESDRAKGAENAARQRLAPWGDPRYAAQVEYELQDGRRYRVARDFASPDVPTTLWDVVTGTDVTDDFGRGRHGNVQFMRQQMGMTKRVFEACAFVSQGELFELVGEGRVTPQEMGDAIISLADTASRDVSAQSAIDRLKATLQMQVGPTQQSRTKPLQVARGRLGNAKRELEEIERIRREVSADADALESDSEQLRILRQDLLRSRYLLSLAENLEIKARLDHLSELESRREQFQNQIAANREFASFPAAERDAVLQSWSTIRDLRERLDTGRTEIETHRQRLAELLRQRDGLVQREQELGHLRTFPIDRRSDVDGLFRSWQSAVAVNRDAQRRLEAAESNALGVLEEHGHLELEVGHLAPSDIQLLTERLRIQSPGPIGALRSAIGGAVLALLRIIAHVATAIFRHRPSASDRQAPGRASSTRTGFDAVSPNDAANILQRHRRYLEIAPEVRRHREEADAAQRARAVLEEKAGRLGEALEGVVDGSHGLEAAYASFQERCAQRNELESTLRRLESHDRERESVQEVIDRSDADEARLKRMEMGLRHQLEAAIGRSASLEELLEAFEKGCTYCRLYQEGQGELRRNEESRGEILGGRSPSELQETLARSETAIADLLAANPSLEGAQTRETREALRERVSRQTQEESDLQLRIRGLRTAIDTRLAGLRSKAEVEEEIERHSQEVASLEDFGSALSVAIEVIGQAMTEAHRDFAPRVGRFLADGLARVTDGRYVEAFLDPATLRVTTKVPETGRLEDVDKLSQGTRAAAYLLLRAGLAQHMSSMSEPVPLILDDPLVDLDDVRLERFLEHLVDLPEAPQIILFTKDEATRAWFERNCSGDPRHKITLLQRRPAPRPATPAGQAVAT